MAGAKGRRWKCRSKPCSICGKWFEPHPRVGKRQKTCGREACQRALHEKASKRWWSANPDYIREDRIRERIRRDAVEVSEKAIKEEPMRQMDWVEVREVVGLQVSVIIEEASQMLVNWTREAVSVQPSVIKEGSRQMRRDGCGRR